MTVEERVRAQGSYTHAELGAAIIADALAEVAREVRRLADIIDERVDEDDARQARDDYEAGRGPKPR